MNASAEGDPDAPCRQDNPRAWTLESLLYTNYRLNDSDFVQAILQAQQSSSALLSSDLFTIGGYGSVRGYQPAQSTGDRSPTKANPPTLPCRAVRCPTRASA